MDIDKPAALRATFADVPRWHFGMLNDSVRNRQYRNAIAKKLPGLDVLDLGMGTGLLSMFAVRVGARHVYGCEQNPAISSIATEIVRANGEASRVTVLGRSSHDLRIEQDIPKRLGGLVTELMDCGMVGEGLLTSVSHARRHLLQDNARIIPEQIEIEFCLIQSEQIFNNNHVEHVDDIDLSTFNRYATPGYFPVRLRAWPFRYLSGRKSALRFDLERGEIAAREELHEITATQPGIAHGIAFWFRAQLAPGIELSNDPQESTHWAQAIHCLERPQQVSRGETIELRIATDLSKIEFTLSDRSSKHA